MALVLTFAVSARTFSTSTATVTEKKQRNKYNGLIEITYDVYNQNGVHVMTDVTRSVILRDVK